MKRILAVFSAALLLSGCAAAPSPFPSGETTPTGGAAASGEPGDPSAAVSGELTYYETYNGTGGADGYYRLSEEPIEGEDGKSYVNLLYIDYATRQEIALCNKPDCRHDNDRCSAYVPALSPGDAQILAAGDTLYLMCSSYTAASSIGSDYTVGGAGTDAVPPTLYRMNRDGTGKTTVAELKSGQVFGWSYLLYDGQRLYTIVDTMESKPSEDGAFFTIGSTATVLMEIDCGTGAVREVCPLKNQRVIGAYNGRLVLSRTSYPVDPQTLEDDDDAYLANVRRSTETILILDPRTGEERQVLSGLAYADTGSLCQSGNAVFYGPQKEGVVNRLDLDSGATKVLTDQLPKGSLSFNRVQAGRLRVEYWEDKYQNAAPTGCRYVDTITGEITELSLTTSKPKEWVDILADAGEDFLVVSDYRSREEYVAWAGVTQTTIEERQYSLIRKEDFWSSRPEYRPIQPMAKEGA